MISSGMDRHLLLTMAFIFFEFMNYEFMNYGVINDYMLRQDWVQY